MQPEDFVRKLVEIMQRHKGGLSNEETQLALERLGGEVDMKFVLGPSSVNTVPLSKRVN